MKLAIPQRDTDERALLNLLRSTMQDFATPTAFAEAMAAELKTDENWGEESVATALWLFERLAVLHRDPCK